jgi:NADPH:quinone reductase-like Zn-dependent oxidoreductase
MTIIKDNTVWEYTKAGRLSGTVNQVTREIPEPGPSELVIKVRAAALNPVDEQLCVPLRPS